MENWTMPVFLAIPISLIDRDFTAFDQQLVDNWCYENADYNAEIQWYGA